MSSVERSAPSALSWLVRLRWTAAAAQGLTILASGIVLRMDIPTGALLGVVAVVLVSNALLATVERRLAASSSVSGRSAFEQRTIGVAIAFDTIALTALLALSGGPINPFTSLYVVQVALAAVLLPPAWTWLTVVLCAIGYGTLFPLHSPASLLAHVGDITFSGHLDGMWVAFVCAAILIALFVGRITRVLMEREQELSRVLRRVERSEKLASLATLAAGAAHEIATPLGTICLAAHEMRRAIDKSDAATELASLGEDTKLISEQVSKCQNILQRMSLSLGSPSAEALQLVSPAALVEEAERELGSKRLVVACEEVAPIEVPVRLLTEALVNVCRNALDASATDQPVALSVRGDADAVVFEVRDSGHGMSPATLARVGEPFFTTKPVGSGMGLGLFVVRTLVETHGGTLLIRSELGAGTTVELHWPRAVGLVPFVGGGR